MLRCTILVVLLIGLAYAAKNETNATSTTPSEVSTTSLPDVAAGNKTKENAGKGYGHEGGRRYNGRHEDHDYYHQNKIISPFPDVKSYFDTHYCSVHGSFALSFNEKTEDKSYDNKGGESYGANSQGGQQNYANTGGYGQPTSGGYGAPGGGYNGGSSNGYGETSGYGKAGDGYGGSNGYKEAKKTKFIRKVTRQYCRYTASWSDKACKFCCRVVARSAFTNPDDITAAIFSFNPAKPADGGAGVEIPKSDDSSPASTYGAPQTSYGQDNGGYSQQGGYAQGGQSQPGYGSQGAYESQGGYGNQGGNHGNGSPPSYQQPPSSYGSTASSYRVKRSNGYPAPNPEQYGTSSSSSYDDSPSTYESQPYDDSKYVNQCVCCAPKHRYY